MGEDSEHSVESVLEARMAETITEKNRVDENKVVTVLCGSESGQKNGKSAADELVRPPHRLGPDGSDCRP